MDRYTRIHAINKVLKEYFEDNPNQGPIPAKEFMELFVRERHLSTKIAKVVCLLGNLLQNSIVRIGFQIFPMLSEK